MKADNLEQLAGEVSPQNARLYALAKGWERVAHVNGGIALFKRADSDLAQLIIPVQPTGPDYARRIVDVLTNLVEWEHRPPEEILRDLLTAEADVIRYRLVSADTARGDLSLEDGVRILEGARRSLLAAACSVLSPVPYHPRMARAEAIQLLGACRLLQTERGSFTVAVACPLRAVEEDRPLFDLETPFTRRTTELLMRSASRLVQAIEADDAAAVFEADERGLVVSANLCDAILRMQPPDERAQLQLAVSWASTRPERTGGVPQRVTFQADYFPMIEDIYRKLRPSAASAGESLFVGYVDTLNGHPGPDGRMQGEARFVLVDDQEGVIRARTELVPEDYQTAVRAHGEAQIVKFKGILHLGRRVHRITNVLNLEILRSVPSPGAGSENRDGSQS